MEDIKFHKFICYILNCLEAPKNQYVYVDGNGNKEDITLNNRTILDTTKKLAYKITPVSDNGFKTSDSNEVIKYQWLLEAKYIEKSYSYTKQIANTFASCPVSFSIFALLQTRHHQ